MSVQINTDTGDLYTYGIYLRRGYSCLLALGVGCDKCRRGDKDPSVCFILHLFVGLTYTSRIQQQHTQRQRRKPTRTRSAAAEPG